MPTASFALTNTKGQAQVNLSNLAQTFDGTQRSASVTTVPSGLGVILTYDGSSTAPTNAGSYQVVATVNSPNYEGQATGTLIINRADQTITFGSLSDKTYGDPTFNVSATSSSGLPVSFQIKSGPATLSGNTVTINGTGTVTITASQAGDSNHNAATPVNRPFNVAKTNQTITFGPLSNKTFGDADFSVSASANSGLSVSFTASGNCTVSGTTAHLTGAGSCTITASQTGDSNYNAAPSLDRSFTINKATAIVTLGSLLHNYNGTAKSATATTNPVNLNVSLSYSQAGQAVQSPINADSYDVSATINDSNYQGHAIGTLVINKATATITLGSLSQVFDGNPKSATATTNPAGKTVVTSYSQNNQPVASPTNAGSYNVSATINDINYQGSATGTLTINKATPTLTWDNPADITYGTALGNAQLNATASVPGTMTYTPAAGTILNAGTNQELSVSFTPTDTTNFKGTSKTVKINVLKAAPVIIWNNPAAITYGTPLDATQLNAMASATGTFVYSPGTGTILNAGSSQTLAANFTPTDTANFNTASKQISINVLKANQTISFNALLNKPTATRHSMSVLSLRPVCRLLSQQLVVAP